MRTGVLTLFFTLTCVVRSQTLNVADLACEYETNPIAIGTQNPRLTWRLVSDQRDVLQTAYSLRAYEHASGGPLIWESGKVNSAQSVNVPYSGPVLRSGTRYEWQVRVWDNKGNTSPWSTINDWEMGLLSPGDWKARWIQAERTDDTSGGPAMMFRKEFSLHDSVVSARLYVSAHGVYEARIDGQRVGNDYLTPGWTSYKKRLQYQVYDVTHLLTAGANAIGATLGDGWYRGLIGFNGEKNFYGEKLAMILQLTVVYADGSRETIVSDRSWKSSTGPVRMSEIYLGETYDARREQPGWDRAKFNDVSWSGVREVNAPKNILIAPCSPPIRKHEVFQPVSITACGDSCAIVDFGQNLVGWVVLRARGNPGDSVVIRHGEVLDRNGGLYVDNLRAAKQEAVYVMKGEAEEVFEPHFTFSGFAM